MKKIARTSVAVGLFVCGLVAAFDYIHAETSALKTTAAAKINPNPLSPEINATNPQTIPVGGK